MKILIVGATGATGKLLTEELLNRGHHVQVIVRSPNKFSDKVRNHNNLSIAQASVLDLSISEFSKYVDGCDAVASCLGHNMDLKGIFGHPRRLVTDTISLTKKTIELNMSNKPVKYVLMNTAGNSNRDINEPISFAQKIVIRMLRLFLPPHVDNEKASDYLRTTIGQNDSKIQWVAVRPEGLIDEDESTKYDVHPSPIRSAIFDAGQTSRINVAHFMADLIGKDEIWQMWKGQMPVIYNKVS